MDEGSQEGPDVGAEEREKILATLRCPFCGQAEPSAFRLIWPDTSTKAVYCRACKRTASYEAAREAFDQMVERRKVEAEQQRRAEAGADAFWRRAEGAAEPDVLRELRDVQQQMVGACAAASPELRDRIERWMMAIGRAMDRLRGDA